MRTPDNQRVVERMAECYGADPEALALVIIASAGRGVITEHSGIDA